MVRDCGGQLRCHLIIALCAIPQLLINNYFRISLVSIHKVTGPSLSRSTFISAPNSPVSTGRPLSRQRAMNASYSGMAVSGRAALVKLGRLPFAAVTVERELRHDEQTAADIRE